jgi:epoxyqueuosine reductase QueG
MDLGRFIEDFVGRYLDDPSTNNLGEGCAEKAWEDFLVGYSSGADPLYTWTKKHIGPFHWTPLEAFTLAHPAMPVVPEDLTVVSFALCQTDATKAANRAQTFYPSERWARSRIFGQECSRTLHVALVEALEAAGYPAVAPFFLPEWSDHVSDRFGRASNWSERHAAYISGLGTFGLSGGIITKKGQAVRFGSIIVRGHIPVTPRPYSGPFAYCLFYANGTCGDCADRCPSGSVSREGRDKEACAFHLDHPVAEHVCSQFGFTGYGCGLCQTGVPCESGIPAPLTESS